MGLINPGVSPVARCCCCCGSWGGCCTIPGAVGESSQWIQWSFCLDGGLPAFGAYVPDGTAELAYGDSLGFVNSVGDDAGAPPQSATLADLLSLQTLNPLDPGLLAIPVLQSGTLGCPCARLPLIGGGKVLGGVVNQYGQVLNGFDSGACNYSQWVLFTLPSGPGWDNCIPIIGGASSAPDPGAIYGLWNVWVTGGVLAIQTAGGEYDVHLGTVSAGQTILIGMECDNLNGTYRVWCNGTLYTGLTGLMDRPGWSVLFFANPLTAGAWDLYWLGLHYTGTSGAFSFDDAVADVEAWVAAEGAPYTPLGALP